MVADLDDVVGSMMADLMDIAEELENWEDGVGFILRGAENKSNTFCSGGDLTTVERISGEAQDKPRHQSVGPIMLRI